MLNILWYSADLRPRSLLFHFLLAIVGKIFWSFWIDFTQHEQQTNLETGSHFRNFLVWGCVFELRMKAGNGASWDCTDELNVGGDCVEKGWRFLMQSSNSVMSGAASLSVNVSSNTRTLSPHFLRIMKW